MAKPPTTSVDNKKPDQKPSDEDLARKYAEILKKARLDDGKIKKITVVAKRIAKGDADPRGLKVFFDATKQIVKLAEENLKQAKTFSSLAVPSKNMIRAAESFKMPTADPATLVAQATIIFLAVVGRHLK